MWSNAGWQTEQGGWYKNKIATAATTTWDGSTKDPNITLSNVNLTATVTSSVYAGVRSVASHSIGKFYAEFHVDQIAVGWDIGIGTSSTSLNGFPAANTNCTALNIFDGQVWLNNANPTGSPVATATTGNVVSMAVDMGNQLIWFRTGAGNWNNVAGGDPTNSSTGHGISFAGIASAPWYVIFAANTTSDACTANFNTATATQSVPVGYGNW